MTHSLTLKLWILKNRTNAYLQKLNKYEVWEAYLLRECYESLMSKQREIAGKIYEKTGIWPVNVGSLAFGRWTPDSDLDLAIGYYTRNELNEILSRCGTYYQITSKFFGDTGINYVVSRKGYDLQIRRWDEIHYLIDGAIESIDSMTPKNHVEWYKFKLENKDNSEVIENAKEIYYKNFIPGIY